MFTQEFEITYLFLHYCATIIFYITASYNSSLFLAACVQFLQRQADSIGLPVKVVEPVVNKPVVVITWEGKNPELPSIMLNSHMDVVPVYPVSIYKFSNCNFPLHKNLVN